MKTIEIDDNTTAHVVISALHEIRKIHAICVGDNSLRRAGLILNELRANQTRPAWNPFGSLADFAIVPMDINELHETGLVL